MARYVDNKNFMIKLKVIEFEICMHKTDDITEFRSIDGGVACSVADRRRAAV